jgi:hypothetical protein
MKTLREFAQFVGKPNDTISIQSLSAHLFSEEASSLSAMMQPFENLPAPFNFNLDVKPQSGSTPLLVNASYANFVGVRIRGLLLQPNGFRILRNGQIIRVIPSETGFAHKFGEGGEGQYVIEGSEEGVGSNGYARVVKTVTVDVKAPPPPPTNWRLSLRLAPSELLLNTLRVISAEWYVSPLWSPTLSSSSTGTNAENRFIAESSLPNPPANSGEKRVRVELKFRCAVQGVINGIQFPYSEFDGIVDPAFIGWENKNLKAGWVGQYQIVQDPNTGLARVIVSAFLQGIEPL